MLRAITIQRPEYTIGHAMLAVAQVGMGRAAHAIRLFSALATDRFDVVRDVAVRREQILPAVVVVVRDRIAPPRVRQGKSRNPRLVGHIVEVCSRVTEEQKAFVCEVCHEQIEVPIVVDVAEGRAHR